MGRIDSVATFTWREWLDPLGCDRWWVDAIGSVREVVVHVASLSDDFGKLIQGELRSEGSIRFARPGIVQEITSPGCRIRLTYEGDLLVEAINEFVSYAKDKDTRRGVYKYDSLQRRIEQERFHHDELISRTVYEYGPEGDCKATSFLKGGSKSISEYNRYGQKVRETILDPQGAAIEGFLCHYDQSGRLLESTTPLSRYTYLYNGAGQLIEEQDRWVEQSQPSPTVSDWLGAFVCKLFPKARRFFDAKPRGGAKYYYDEKGNVNKLIRWQGDEREIVSEQFYDEKGNVTKRWGTSTLSGERTAVEVYTYEYDAVGNWTKRTTSELYEDTKRCKPIQVAVRSIAYFE